LREVVRRRGVPLALYSDRHTIFQSRSDEPLSLEQQLAGGRPPTQVGRVLKELNVEWIGARSPQAKGRVERLWRTLQDRLYQELRLANVSTLERRTPRSPGPAQRSLSPAARDARFRLPPSASRNAAGRGLLLPLLAHRQHRQRRHAGRPRHPDPAGIKAPLLRSGTGRGS
jgi:hypothetical protein